MHCNLLCVSQVYKDLQGQVINKSQLTAEAFALQRNWVQQQGTTGHPPVDLTEFLQKFTKGIRLTKSVKWNEGFLIMDQLSFNCLFSYIMIDIQTAEEFIFSCDSSFKSQSHFLNFGGSIALSIVRLNISTMHQVWSSFTVWALLPLYHGRLTSHIQVLHVILQLNTLA